MSGKLSTHDEKLKKAVGDLDEVKTMLGDTIRNLTTVVDGISSHWRSDAQVQYAELQRRVNEDVRKLNEYLDFTREALQASRDGFNQNEADRLNSFKIDGGAGSSAVLSRFNVTS
ncbi:WXG100 family type VII secretion target [Streptomyces syringium]|uniref:WXG100 family type VII secretion target n=1 Tax=Streptomyces syringium TaxID=76729 RepID=UPI0036667A80